MKTITEPRKCIVMLKSKTGVRSQCEKAARVGALCCAEHAKLEGDARRFLMQKKGKRSNG